MRFKPSDLDEWDDLFGPSLAETPIMKTGNAAFDRLRQLWTLRGLCKMGGPQLKQLLEHPMDARLILGAVGLDEWLERDGEIDPLALHAALVERLNRQRETPIGRDGQPFDNLIRIGKLLRLSATETELCLFAAMLQGDRLLSEVADYLGPVDDALLPTLLADLLDQPVEALRHALRRNSLPAQLGLVRVDRNFTGNLRGKLDVLSGLAGLLLADEDIENVLFQRCLQKAPPARLTTDDFAHVGEAVELLTGLLDAAVSTRRSGVNVLVYGPPGTGKTELVRTLAGHCGLELYQVSSMDEDGDPLKGDHRIGACRMAQYLLERRERCLLLFDEAEDVFPSHGGPFAGLLGQSRNASGSKAWMNQLLEENPRPCFWLSNAIDQIDPAFLRRFDYVLELDVPPRAVRERMLRRHLAGVPVSDAWLKRMAGLEQLSPALIERAGRVSHMLEQDAEQARHEARLEHILGNTLRAMGHAHQAPALPLLGDYDLSLLNVEGVDPETLISGLVRQGQGRLCLYGPPGTGKSEFARHLAERLDRPLVRGQAADLLDMFVGGTEKNIARLFERADREQAVLVIDEVDSFLQDRGNAHQNWEVTQVNELLTRMERFEGLLVCTTNRMDGLDQAVLRRFDLKLKLGYLRPEQRQRLFRQLLEDADAALSEAVEWGLDRLDNLTPGDFAAVQRKLALLGPASDAEALLALITEESRLKPDARQRPIGFVH